MNIRGLQKISLVDWPGKIAATIFIGGCNLRCPYCHNPQLALDDYHLPHISIDEIRSFLERRKDILDGVCITGGEPLLQRDLIDLIHMIKAECGLKVKLDTNGSCHKQLYNLIFDLKCNYMGEFIDYISIDIKLPDINNENSKILDDFSDKLISDLKFYQYAGVVSHSYEYRVTVTAQNFKAFPLVVKALKKYRGWDKLVIQRFRDTGNILFDNIASKPVTVAGRILEFFHLISTRDETQRPTELSEKQLQEVYNAATHDFTNKSLELR